MMASKDKALRMAIEVMNNYNDGWTPDEMVNAIKACKEALEQPAREPLSQSKKDELVTEWMHLDGSNPYTLIASVERAHGIGEQA